MSETKLTSQPMGTFACPICGEGKPHPHTVGQIVQWLQAQAGRFLPHWQRSVVIAERTREPLAELREPQSEYDSRDSGTPSQKADLFIGGQYVCTRLRSELIGIVECLDGAAQPLQAGPKVAEPAQPEETAIGYAVYFGEETKPELRMEAPKAEDHAWWAELGYRHVRVVPLGAWQPPAQQEEPAVTFSLREATELLSLFGGSQSLITVRMLPEGDVKDEEDRDWISPAGLWGHFTEYPEEGCFYLGPVDQLEDYSPAQQELTQADHAGCHGLDTPERVRFYEHDFYVLSNFSAFSIKWQGRRFPTSEHAYHWEKFAPGTKDEHGFYVRDHILMAESAHAAFKMAEAWKPLRRPEWDEVKVDIMRGILRAKARQHEYVLRKLLATGDRELVEDSWRDDFWGWGPNRDGQNMLGRLWMEVRAELRASAAGAQGDQQ